MSRRPAAEELRCPQCEAPPARKVSRYCRDCGIALEPVGASAPTGSDEDPPGRRRLRGWLVVGGVVAALVLTAGTLRVLQITQYSPEEPVEEAIALIEAGEAEAIAELSEHDSPLLTNEATSEGYTPPEDMRVTGVSYHPALDDPDTQRPNRDLADVSVTYTINGEELSTSVRVSREDFGWLRGWQIRRWDSILGAVAVTSHYVETARVAAAEVPIRPSDTRPDEHFALPGTYTVAATDDHPLFEGGEADDLTVPVYARSPLAFSGHLADFDIDDLEARPTLVEEVVIQVSEHIAECAEDTTLRPGGRCPLAVERDAFLSVSDVQWTVLEEPEIRLFSGEDSLGRPIVEVETTTPGSAEAGITHTYASDQDRTETVEVTVGGRVDTDEDGEIVWHP